MRCTALALMVALLLPAAASLTARAGAACCCASRAGGTCPMKQKACGHASAMTCGAFTPIAAAALPTMLLQRPALLIASAAPAVPATAIAYERSTFRLPARAADAPEPPPPEHA